ncbi:unnamed protein product [Boreogadus saida]
MNARLEVLALVRRFLGLVGKQHRGRHHRHAPRGRVTAFIGAVVMEMTWEGGPVDELRLAGVCSCYACVSPRCCPCAGRPTTVIADFYDPVWCRRRCKRELGAAALYVGWAAAAAGLLLAAGGPLLAAAAGPLLAAAGPLLAAGVILVSRYSARREKERGTPTYGAEGEPRDRH